MRGDCCDDCLRYSTTLEAPPVDYAALEAAVGREAYAALSEAERDCVSRKIGKLADEGYADPKQRVAIAIKHCAPTKSTADSAAVDAVAVEQRSVGRRREYSSASLEAALELSHDHEVVHEPDGRVRVKGVPIFAENVRKFPNGQTLAYGRGWLRSAVASDRRARAGGYSAPMHFGHHEPGSTRERAGSVELADARLALFEGKPTWVLFADLVYDSRDKFDRARKDFPYRSVEISPDRPRDVNSLALLSSEAPYFRFPNLNPSYAATPDGGHAFLWRTSTMTDATKPAEANPRDAAAPAAPPAATAAAEPAKFEAPAGIPAPATTKPEDRLGSVDKKAASFMDDGGISASLARIEALLVKLLERDSDDGKPAASPHAPPPVVMAQAAPAVEPTRPAADPRVAELEGQVRGLSEKLVRLEADKLADALYKTLATELEGYALGTQWQAELRRHVAEGGERTARAYVNGIKNHVAKVPPASGDATPPAPQAVDAPEVAKWAAKGKGEEARRLAALYEANRDRHAGFSSQTKGSFIDAQLEGVK